MTLTFRAQSGYEWEEEYDESDESVDIDTIIASTVEEHGDIETVRDQNGTELYNFDK